MQFKHPEILWALLVLLIPIIIHLFQLRRFKKTPFTNVKFLKKVVSESRKSNTIKKWLILCTRLFLLAGLVLAFAQPFSAKEEALQAKENVFYLDNSFSMQVKKDSGTLLENIVQSFLKSIPEELEFTLFTNNQVFKNVTKKDIQNDLLDIEPATKQLSIQEIILKAQNYFNSSKDTQHNTILISDFQQRMGELPSDRKTDENIYFIKPSVGKIENASIDSLYLQTMNTDNIELVATLSTNTVTESIPVSLYNGDKLIAKTAAKFGTNKKASVSFSLPNGEPINGRIIISDTGLEYDNEFFFNISTPERIKVLAIGETETGYLNKIYDQEEFDFKKTSLNQLNYSEIASQNLVVLNELERIPTALANAIESLTKDGGSVVLIPAKDIDYTSYNQFTNNYANTRFQEKIGQEAKVSGVILEHPLFQNVFERKVADFQYPKVSSYYRLKANMRTALRFQNNESFLTGNGTFYCFSASISTENSNFKNSPLIVPAFYNMAINSLKLPALYHTIGQTAEVEIPISLSQDNILKVSKEGYEFIPQQRALPKKVKLLFEENPKENGIFEIKNKENIQQLISFNYDRKESQLLYTDISLANNINIYDAIPDFFQDVQKNNSINEFWKWFAILALLFVLIETMLQRFLK
ncbi:BatA domain-containing protein [Maribacter sp. 2210JD10-5]|uniref:BatA domain-containing protein n=1 Tax=Maribacter sp. 2210JD10-5 TaxID=3386272 RepID=UPI0039BC87C2